MTETGLIVAQVAFLLLLYLFVWSVVRSGGKQVEQGPPPPPMPVDSPVAAPAARRRGRRAAREMAMAAPAAAAPAPPPPAVVPPPPPAEPPTHPSGQADEDDGLASESGAIRRARARSEGMGLDMAANLSPRLIVERSPTLEEGREIDLEGGVTIGRSEASGIRISDSFVSHMHARIMRRGAYWFVEDLGSTNGTYLNDRRIDRDAQLKVHDELRLGETVLRYEE